MQDTFRPSQSLFPSNTALVIVALFIVALIGSWNFYLRNKPAIPTPIVSPTPLAAINVPEVIASPTPLALPTPIPVQKIGSDAKGITTLVVTPIELTSFQKFSIRVPNDWTIQTPSTDTRIELSNGQYTLGFTQADTGAVQCVFSDTNITISRSELLGAPIKKFITIAARQGKFRRYEVEGYTSPDGRVAYNVCEWNKKLGEYSGPSAAAQIRYTTPAQPDEAVLKAMDAIISTLQYCTSTSCPTELKTSVTTKFTGTISESDTGCFVDGICKIKVNGTWVILATGERMPTNPPVESGVLLGLDGISPASIGDMSVGRSVEVYAAKTTGGDLTLQGKNTYYVKLLK